MIGPSRHIWCERIGYEALVEPRVTSALRERAIQPIVAVTPATLDDAPDLVARLRAASLPVALWPMLEPRDGRWASLYTWPRYAEHAVRLLDRLDARDCMPDEVAIDLEPPLHAMRAAIDARPLHAIRLRTAAAASDVARCIDAMHARGIRVSAAVIPVAVAHPRRVGRGWQRLLGTPIDDAPFDRISAMAYSSLLEGYARGLLARRDVRGLVADTAIDMVRRYGARASLSLGCVGPGTLGDERCYRSPDELAEDVAIAHAAGVEDLALFDLGGVLARPPMQRWLDAFVEPPAPIDTPHRTVRALGVRALSFAVGLTADLLSSTVAATTRDASDSNPV